MAKFKLILFFTFLLTGAFQLQAQNRYAIHYKFKPQEGFSLAQPAQYLTSKSIERRERQAIAIDSLDLPVSEKYIQEVRGFVDGFLYHSKWENASLVIAKEESITAIQDLPFVEKVVLAAPGFVADGTPLNRTKEKVGLTINLNLKAKTNKANAAYEMQNAILGIQEMHEAGFKGKGVTVAVFDAGFPGVDQIPAFSHLFDNGQLIGTRDFVHVWNDNVFTKNQHGTNVLSLMATNDPDVIVAAAPEADYILCITEEVATEYRIEEYNWIKAAEFADSLGVDIINSSLGYWDFDDRSMNYTVEDMDGETALISRGANIAGTKGILVVTSAGNYGTRGEFSITAPADAKGILAIGAVNSSLQRAGFSSKGPTVDGRIKPDVSTYGEQVWLLRPNGNLGTSNGTSFSSPQVAAFAAGLWQARPEWTKDQLIDEILKSSSQANNPDNLLGYGIPNFVKAYFGEVLGIVEEENEDNWKVYPNPIHGTELYVKFGNQEVGEFSLIDPNGKVLQKANVKRTSIQDPFEVLIPDLPTGVYVVEMYSGNQVKRTKLMKR